MNVQPTALCVLGVGFVKAPTPVGPCTLYIGINSPYVGLFAVANAAGFATAALGIPLNPILMGLPLTAQGIAVNPTASGSLTFSQALDLVVGS